MQNLTIFNYNNTSIEFEVINGEVFANATKMCKAFNKTPYEFLRSDKTQRYVEALRKNNEVEFIETRNGGVNPGTWIHEKLILKLAQWLDVDFEIWCDDKISEVLKNGTESKPQLDFSDPDTIIQLARNWKEEREKVLFLERKSELQEEQLKISAPKVAYVDEVLQSKSTYTTTLIAKELGMSAIELNKKLFEMHIQHKQSGVWVLYAKFQNKNYTKTTTHSYTDIQGETSTNMLTVWTESGRKLIHDILKQKISA